jgi:hypothetical protein
MPNFNSIEFSGQRPLLKEITADRLNAILTEIKRNKPLPGRGITTRASGSGICIDLAEKSTSPTPVSETLPFPFQVSVASFLVSVRPGTINSLLPTNIFETFSIVENTTKYVVLNGVTDGKQFTACTISLDETAPSAQTPVVFGLPASPKFLLAVVRNTSVFQIISDNMLVAGKQQYIKSKAAPAAAGELPYEIYFVWQ